MATFLRQTNTEGTYAFASQPRAVPQRKKFRDTSGGNDVAENLTLYGNIMYDRRVIRGNTYSQQTLPASAYVDPVEVQRQKETRRREIAKKRAKQMLRVKSPDPVDGRRHVEMQTELYLEELSDRVEETEAECQTDAFLDRPPSPLFVPAKTGVDQETQILEGELFDFNVEVIPVLEVLVGKTMEQALLEVMEEEELYNLREQQRAFEELRNADLMEQQRLEEQERRRREEKERRMTQQLEMAKKEKETADKIAARAFAQSYLADLVPSVFGTLSENGYFFDPVEREVEKTFLPWLMDGVDKELTLIVRSRMLVDEILQTVVDKRRDDFAKLREKEEAEKVKQESSHLTVTFEDVPTTTVIAREEDEDEDGNVPTEGETGDEDDMKTARGEDDQEPQEATEPETATDPVSDDDPKTEPETED